MDKASDQVSTVDEYIDLFPDNVREQLTALRQAIREEAPEAEETIKYRIPTFMLRGYLVHFAAYKDHIGFYPTSSPMETFKEELAPFQTSRGAVRFPMDQPLPLELVRRIVRFRVKENLERGRKNQRATRREQ